MKLGNRENRKMEVRIDDGFKTLVQKMLLICTMLLSSFFALGQESANLIVFAEDSIPFFLDLNGKRLNDTAYWNFKIQGLENESNEITVSFGNEENPALSKKILFQEMNVEATLKLTNGSSGYKLRYFGEVSMGAAPIDDQQKVIDIHAPKSKSLSNESAPVSFSNTLSENNSQVTSVTTYSSATSNVITAEGLSEELNSDDIVMVDSSQFVLYDSLYAGDQQMIAYLSNYKGNKGCELPEKEVGNILLDIQNASFSSQKLTLAKKKVKSICLTTEQVARIANSLEYEDDRLDFVKFAKAHVYDLDNYGSLVKIFNFERTRESFKTFNTTP